MLLTLPIIFATFSLLSDSSVYNIYNAIRRFYNNNANLPDNDTGLFFQASGSGFVGCTKKVLLKVIEVLQQTAGWLDAPDNVQRQAIFTQLSQQIATVANCDPAGILKFCNWCYIAAVGDSNVYKYFSTPGSKYTIVDDLVAQVSTGISSKVDTAKEYVDYLVTPSSSTTVYARINPVIKWAILGTAAYIVIKKIVK